MSFTTSEQHLNVRHFPIAVLMACVLILAGCGVHDRALLTPDAATYEGFEPVGVPYAVRAFGDLSGPQNAGIVDDLTAALRQRGNSNGLNILALSGGGPDGAYGAGVLNGWTATGQRPEFDIVTGISTGAIIAPFAFLGPDYDGSLTRFYTTTDTTRIARFRILPAVISGGALADNAPLARAIEEELTDAHIRRIGEEHRKGRRLIIGTTNMDAERPVLWDIGELANVNTPEAFALVRRVILASAAIPVFFQPVRIPVSDGTSVKEELHVDGALTQQIFTYPSDLPLRSILKNAGLANKDNTVWLIHNKRLEPRFEAQSTRLGDMADRTLNTLIRSQSYGDIAFILALAERDGLRVNGLAVPPRFDKEPQQAFDPVYMSELYRIGVEDGSDPQTWYRDLDQVLFGEKALP
ncbi:patatin-like phospholipase family protein [Tateyamaria omphalii]|uniref:patatin-like phospholipase family protein n=1 Tax=Tateyamaria omphalii TaxID=299262 RepID=UPI001C996557|nr:patatin-like phospholipase family protein [Tateyamaria omphalii]MBY5934949.1 patatin-like phospholipase family protein [Tateyamaria omphalii]